MNSDNTSTLRRFTAYTSSLYVQRLVPEILVEQKQACNNKRKLEQKLLSLPI